MYLARNLIPGISFPALRDKFKRKDHTTVVYACERVEKEIKRDQSTKAVIDELTKQLKGKSCLYIKYCEETRPAEGKNSA